MTDVTAALHLFNIGDYTFASGQKHNFKIDCDALSNADVAALADYIGPKLPPFGPVIGVPWGGLRFAAELERYSDPQIVSPRLIADDVWTTGGSVAKYRELNDHCVVIFARSWVPEWVTAIFQLNA